MPRGGKRQGTPGKAYGNRTDLGMNYANAGASAAGGGLPPVAQSQTPTAFPEDTPNLLDVPSRDLPVTDGLSLGAGRGPEAMVNADPRVAETAQLKRWLPLLEPIGNDPSTPDSVRTLIRYIRGS